MNRRKTTGILSAIVMGSGQIYNGEIPKGIMLFVFQVLYVINIINGNIIKAFKGLITLGDVPGVKGDHSIILLVNGVIVLIISVIYIGVYIFNINDAIEQAKKKEKGIALPSTREFFKNVSTSYFPLVVLSPIFV